MKAVKKVLTTIIHIRQTTRPGIPAAGQPSVLATATWIACLWLALDIGGCRLMDQDTSRHLLGGIEVQNERTQTGLTQPGAELPNIYVEDFKLDAGHFQAGQGLQGMIPGGAPQTGLGERLSQRLPHPLATEDPSAKARQIVDNMSAALVDRFAAKGIHARRWPADAGPLPVDGWLVQGMFTEVDEGNRIKRAVIGFGKGATSMDVQVGISNLAGRDPRQPFMAFGTIKDPSQLPGAVVTINPYVAAAKFVMEKDATEKDIRQTADQIVDEILKYEQKLRQEADSRR